VGWGESLKRCSLVFVPFTPYKFYHSALVIMQERQNMFAEGPKRPHRSQRARVCPMNSKIVPRMESTSFIFKSTPLSNRFK